MESFKKIVSEASRVSYLAYENILCGRSFHLTLLLAMTALYGTVLSFLSVYNYNRFLYSAFDLGIFDQGIWLLSQGENAFVTVRGLHIFGDHLQFIIAFLAPLFWIWDDTRVLLIAQSVAIAFGALPLYLIAKSKLRNRFLPLLVVPAYIMYPALHYLNLDNFHPYSLAVPILLFAFYFLTNKKYGLYAFCIVLALITKEDIAVTVFMLGLYALLFNSRRIGVVTILSAVIILLTYSDILFYFNGVGYIYGRYGAFNEFGSTPFEAVMNVVLKPQKFAATLLTEMNTKYVYNIFAPVAFLSFLSPTTLAIGVPAILMNLATGWPYAHSIEYHHTKAIIPFVFISVVYGLSSLERLSEWRGGWVRLVFRGLFCLAFVALIAASIYGNTCIGPSQTSVKNYKQVIEVIKNYEYDNQSVKVIHQAINIIPKDATVSATYQIVPHMSHRKVIYMFPNPFKDAYWGAMLGNFTPPTPTKDVDYIILDIHTVNTEDKNEIIDKFVAEGRYSKVFLEEDVLVLKKAE